MQGTVGVGQADTKAQYIIAAAIERAYAALLDAVEEGNGPVVYGNPKMVNLNVEFAKLPESERIRFDTACRGIIEALRVK
jgi:hypothetical protein